MGSVGTGFTNSPTNQTEFTVFNSYKGSQKWFDNPDLSNSSKWEGLLTDDEKSAIKNYTGSGYSINEKLGTIPWDEMSPQDKKKATNIFNGLNKFELKKGIHVTRVADSLLFGKVGMTTDEINASLAKTNGIVQVDTFISSGANNHGKSVDSYGVVYDFKIPPSVGAGAYVNPISHLKGEGENEFLINNNGVFKFGKATMGNDGNIHISGEWLGQAKKQSGINFKSEYKKKGNKK